MIPVAKRTLSDGCGVGWACAAVVLLLLGGCSAAPLRPAVEPVAGVEADETGVERLVESPEARGVPSGRQGDRRGTPAAENSHSADKDDQPGPPGTQHPGTPLPDGEERPKDELPTDELPTDELPTDEQHEDDDEPRPPGTPLPDGDEEDQLLELPGSGTVVDGTEEDPEGTTDGEAVELQPATGKGAEADSPAPAFGESKEQGSVSFGRRLAKAASSMVGTKKPKAGGMSFRKDCSGLVMAIYTKAGCYSGNSTVGAGGTSAAFELCRAQDRLFSTSRLPKPGDLVFFDNTYDRNGNGKCDDWLSHIGVVVKVQRDGTVHFVHWGRGGAKEGRLNLNKPSVGAAKNGKRYNDAIRVQKKRDRDCVRYMAGELFRAYCNMEEPCGE